MSINPFRFSYTDDIDLAEYSKAILRLRRPEGPIDVVLDTDTYNEVDDQYALAYLLQSSDKLRLQAIYAAPFLNHHSDNPGDGMKKSYYEIFHVLDLIDRAAYSSVVYKGADAFLTDEYTPSISDASRNLVERAMQHTTENPLYVIGIAACTNIASAILSAPEIADRIFIVWLGGQGMDWHDNFSFNAQQDVSAARVILNSKAPLVLLPGRGVVDHFHTTGPELEYWLRGKNQFCDYIVDKTIHEASLIYGNQVWSRPLSDVTAVAWLLDRKYMLDRLEPSPIMELDHYYGTDKRRHCIRYVYGINRDALMQDLFEKLSTL